jgi:uncharacterized protein (TIGR02391 family)
MARKASVTESVPPTLSPQRAIELLHRQLDQFDRINALHSDDPEVRKWESTTEGILRGAFGQPHGERHELTAAFARFYGSLIVGMPDYEYERTLYEGMLQKKAVLESCVEQLEILAPPAAQVAPDQYRFHPEIERVSGQLLRDGHYRSAALDAYIRVIQEVRARSGLNLDGDILMNHAFGCDNRTPIIQFNALQTDAERDEQKGFMFLFKGIVGLRNSKAHSNQLFNDPCRAHDYLALASVLMRVLEIATVNRTP